MIGCVWPSRVAPAPRLFHFLKTLALASGLVCGTVGSDTIAGEIYEWKGGATPALVLPSLSGPTVNLGALKGKVVLVNFWATWCEPCVAEMPSLETLRKTLGTDAVEILGVNLGESQQRVAKFVEKLDVSFPVLLDRDAIAKRDWKVGGVPVTFVVGLDGRIVFRIVGETDFNEPALLTRLRTLAAKKPASARSHLSMR